MLFLNDCGNEIRTFALGEQSQLKANFLELDANKVTFELRTKDGCFFSKKVKKLHGFFFVNNVKEGDILWYYLHGNGVWKDIYCAVVSKSPTEISLAFFDLLIECQQFVASGSLENFKRDFKFSVSPADKEIAEWLDKEHIVATYKRADGKCNVYDFESNLFVLPKWYERIERFDYDFVVCWNVDDSVDIYYNRGGETEAMGLSEVPTFLCDSELDCFRYFEAYRKNEYNELVVLSLYDDEIKVLN